MTFGDAHGHPGCHGCQMCFAEALHDVLLNDDGPTPTGDECPVCNGAGGPLLDEWGYERAPCPGGCDTPPATVVPESEAP